MFIDSELVEIKIYYKKIGHLYSVFGEKDFLENKALRDEDRKKYQSLSVKMKVMDWGTFNDLQDASMTTDPTGERKFNYKLYKENRLQALIAEWDVKDPGGNPIPVSIENIRKMAPNIAETILGVYDASQFLSGDDEKK